MKNALRIVVLLWVMLIIPELSAQTWFFDNYSVRDGLAQSNVYDLEQDSRGYIWLGTASGASRFDGSRFINYSRDEGLADNGVRALTSDPENAIWMGHIGGGISRVSCSGEIQHILLPGFEEHAADITDLVVIDNNQLWIASNGAGLFVARNIFSDSLTGLNITRFKGEEGLSDRIFSIYQHPDGDIYLITDVGVKIWNRKENTFDFFRLKGIPKFFSITCITRGYNGDLWFGTYNGGLFHYNIEKHEFELFDHKQVGYNWISTLYEDRDKNLWIGTWGGGLTRLKDGKFTNFNKSNGLQDNKIRCITGDREGNILIGTNESGLSIFKGSHMVTFTEDDSLINNHVWAIQSDHNGNFWFGTNNGISVYNPDSKSFHHLNKEDDLTSNQIRFIKKDRDHNLWVGMWNGGGIIYKTKDENSFNYPYNINRYLAQISRGNVTAMTIDSQNNLWVGTYDGLLYFEINGGGLAHLTQTSGLSGNDITSLYAAEDAAVWVGSRNKGVTLIRDTVFTPLLQEQGITPTSFALLSNGQVWVGTESKGIFVLNEKLELKEHYTAPDHLLSNYISALSSDEHDNIYIGTNNGLNKYFSEEKTFQYYTERNGFTGIEVKPAAIYRDKKGRIWFGTVQGVTRFDPAKESRETVMPITHIESFQVNYHDHPMTENLKLPYNRNSVTLGFNSVFLTDPEAVKYRFILDGADPGWRYSEQGMNITYTSLPPGDYTFKVMARNNKGMWNEQPTTFSFRINPPFWQTWWFILMVVLVALAVVYAYIRIRETKLRREKAILEQKVKHRTKKIREQNIDLENKNKAIFDSINYARRIQTAIMHDHEQLLKLHSESMLLYKPKDIVSGDFYWFARKQEKLILVAADCTGHGVPGAFMSMIGISTLNQIINERNILKPSDILHSMRSHIISELQQTGKAEDSKDGMDIALAVIDEQKQRIEFAGAYNSLYIVRKEKAENLADETHIRIFEEKLLEVKGDRMPIGISEKAEVPFRNHQLDLKHGDELFLSTDGYIDQFGGKKNKKLMARRFKNILLEAYKLPVDQQTAFLDKKFTEWRGNNEQIDDVLIIGTKW